jgi:hypothetical protein
MMHLPIAIAAGIVGAGGMSLFMWLATRFHLANADMLRAVGSILTKRYENAFLPGLLIHLAMGAGFSLVYAAFIGLFGANSFASYIVLGAAFGIFHGLVVSFTLVVLVAQYHPLERFQSAGVEVAAAHFLGHVIYGLIVGTILGFTKTAFRL